MVQITVIIPTRNRPLDLQRCLSGLLDNDRSLLKEVIVVDDGSKIPLSKDSCPGLPIHWMRCEKPMGAAACRNLASKAVTSDVIAFLDDDAVPTPDWLSIIAQELTPDRGGITGRVIRFDSGIVSAARQARYNARYSSLSKYEQVPFFSGGNSAVWTNLFVQAGGFNSHGSGGDNGLVHDLERQGYHVHFIPELIILHRNSKGVKKAVIEAYNSGRAHPKQLGIKETIRRIVNVKQAAIGETTAIALFNWVLNTIHLLGKAQMRRDKNTSSYLTREE